MLDMLRTYPCDWNKEARWGRDEDERTDPVDALELHDPRALFEVQFEKERDKNKGNTDER